MEEIRAPDERFYSCLMENSLTERREAIARTADPRMRMIMQESLNEYLAEMESQAQAKAREESFEEQILELEIMSIMEEIERQRIKEEEVERERERRRELVFKLTSWVSRLASLPGKDRDIFLQFKEALTSYIQRGTLINEEMTSKVRTLLGKVEFQLIVDEITEWK